MFKVGDVVIARKVDKTISTKNKNMHVAKEPLLGNIYKIYHIYEKGNHQYISAKNINTNQNDMMWVWFETELELYNATPRDKIKSELMKEVT